MSDENRNDEKNGKKNGEFKFSLRGYILWTVMLGAVLLLMFFRTSSTTQGDNLDQIQFWEKVNTNLIVKAIITYDPQSPYLRKIKGTYLKGSGDGGKLVET